VEKLEMENFLHELKQRRMEMMVLVPST